MKIKVRDIPHEGMRFEETVTADELGFAEEGIAVLSPLSVTIRAEAAGQTLIVNGTVAGRYRVSCARCLEPVEEDRSDAFELFFEIGPKTEYVSLDEDIRQELVVDLAEIEHCRADCKGLCPGCGVNLNKEQCQCAKSSGPLATNC